jgi:hypothetical protein
MARKKGGHGPPVPPSVLDTLIREDIDIRTTRRPDGTRFVWWKDKADRQRRAVEWRQKGESIAMIAMILGVSTRTIKRDLAAFWRQLGVTPQVTPRVTPPNPCHLPEAPEDG